MQDAVQQANDNHQQWQGNNTHLYLFAVSGLAEDKAESCRDESVRTRGLRELLQWPLTLAGVIFLHPLPTQSLSFLRAPSISCPYTHLCSHSPFSTWWPHQSLSPQCTALCGLLVVSLR